MNDTTFQGNGKVAYVPVVVNAKQQKPQTNADRIRAMTDEKLAELFWIRADCELCPNKEPYCSDDCKKHWLDWLKEEAASDG